MPYFLAIWLLGATLAQAMDTRLISTCDVAAVAVATTPAPPISTSNYRIFEEQSRSTELKSPSTVVLGDSLARNFPMNLLEEMSQGGGIYRAGMSGDKTQHILWRVQNLGLEKFEDPQNVILFAGVNQFNSDDPVCATVIGILTIFEETRELWPSANIIVVGVSGRGPYFLANDAGRRQVNAELSKQLENEAAAEFIDVSDVLMCGQQGEVSLVQRVQTWFGVPTHNCIYYQQDWLHWTSDGYALLVHEISQR